MLPWQLLSLAVLYIVDNVVCISVSLFSLLQVGESELWPRGTLTGSLAPRQAAGGTTQSKINSMTTTCKLDYAYTIQFYVYSSCKCYVCDCNFQNE